jgi:hypothetical protein
MSEQSFTGLGPEDNAHREDSQLSVKVLYQQN